MHLTFEVDDCSTDFLNFRGMKIDDVLGWIQFVAFPYHRASYRWGECVWNRADCSITLQALDRGLCTKNTARHGGIVCCGTDGDGACCKACILHCVGIYVMCAVDLVALLGKAR